MNKTNLIIAVAAVVLIGMITLVKTDGKDTQQAADKATTTTTQTATATQAPTTQTQPTSKPVAKNTTQSKTPAQAKTATQTNDTTVSADNTTRVRRGPPSKRFYASRISDEPKIAPATEYRTWTTQQWASKVNTLRQQGQHDLAQQYVVAYEKTYPNKSLAPYLK